MSLDTSDFMKEDFDPYVWINSIVAQNVPLDKLQCELKTFISSQKQRLSEFLNKNYSEFLSLPSSLQGTLASIQFVQENISLLSERTDSTLSTVEETLGQVKQCVLLQRQTKQMEDALLAMEEACCSVGELYDSIESCSQLPMQISTQLHLQASHACKEDEIKDLVQIFDTINKDLSEKSFRTLSLVLTDLAAVYLKKIQQVFPNQMGSTDFQRESAKFTSDIHRMQRKPNDPRLVLMSPAFANIFTFVLGGDEAMVRLRRMQSDFISQTEASRCEVQQDSSLAVELLNSCSILPNRRRIEFATSLEQAVDQFREAINSASRQSTSHNQRTSTASFDIDCRLAQMYLSKIQVTALLDYSREVLTPTEAQALYTIFNSPSHKGIDGVTVSVISNEDASNYHQSKFEREQKYCSLMERSPNPFKRSRANENLSQIILNNSQNAVSIKVFISAAKWHREQAKWTNRLEDAIGASMTSATSEIQNSGGTECFTTMVLSIPLITRQLMRLSLLIRRSTIDGSILGDKNFMVPLSSETPQDAGSTPLVDALSSIHSALETMFTDQLSSLLIQVCCVGGLNVLSQFQKESYFSLGITLFEALHALDKASLAKDILRELFVRPFLSNIFTRNAIVGATLFNEGNLENQLPSLYEDLLSRLKEQFSFVCNLCSHPGTSKSVYTFDFIHECFWPEVVLAMKQPHCGVLFAAIPETFAPSVSNFLLFFKSVSDYANALASQSTNGVASDLFGQTKSLLTKWSISTFIRLIQIQVQSTLMSRDGKISILSEPYRCNLDSSPLQAVLETVPMLTGEEFKNDAYPLLWIRSTAQAMNTLLYIWGDNVLIPQTLIATVERTIEIGNSVSEDLALCLRTIKFLPTERPPLSEFLTALPDNLNEFISWRALSMSDLSRRASKYVSQVKRSKLSEESSNFSQPLPTLFDEIFCTLNGQSIASAMYILSDIVTLTDLLEDRKNIYSNMANSLGARLRKVRFIRMCSILSGSQATAQKLINQVIETLQTSFTKTIVNERLKPLKRHIILLLSCYVASEALSVIDPGIKAIKSEYLGGDRIPDSPSNYVSLVLAPFTDLIKVYQVTKQISNNVKLSVCLDRLCVDAASAYAKYVFVEVKKQLQNVISTTSAAHASLMRIKVASGVRQSTGLSIEDKVQKQVWIDVTSLCSRANEIVLPLLNEAKHSFDSYPNVAQVTSEFKKQLLDLEMTIGEAIRDELK